MAKVKDKMQLLIIKNAAKEFSTSENEITHFLVEMGCAWCILSNKSIVEREDAFKKFDGQFESNPVLQKLMKRIFDDWTAGGDAIGSLNRPNSNKYK